MEIGFEILIKFIIFIEKICPFCFWKYCHKDHEILNARRFINKCIDFGFKKIAVYVWLQLFLLQPISKYNFRFWKILLKKKHNVSDSYSVF
jgi:hypothetical protein